MGPFTAKSHKEITEIDRTGLRCTAKSGFFANSQPLTAGTLGVVVVQLSLVGEADGHGLLSANNTLGCGAERSFGPSIWQKVIKIVGHHIEPSPTAA